MRLTAGTRLGHYEIHSFLGQGSIGEVYRAQDTRARRAVALKILRADLRDKETIRKRFEREAKVLSGLSHPHICAFHEMGQAEGIDYLVMEYLGGENLSQVLARGPLPVDKALLYASQICSALDASHQLGLTHRDLKPANIMLGRQGVKILDFGLAKVGDPLDGDGAEQDGDEASTIAEAVTEAGTILGTYPYMAPEQLEGKAVDPRADIFAFGAILYEMVTGRRAFEGKSKAGTIASVLTQNPPKMGPLRPDAPAALEWLLEGCLAKDPGDRWQTIRDVKRCLEQVAAPPAIAAPPAPAVRPNRVWMLAAVMLAAVAGWAIYTRPASKAETVRLLIQPPPGYVFAPFASHGGPVLSPDGKQVLFTAQQKHQHATLWIRSLDNVQARQLEGTLEAKFPIWSHDGNHVAFAQGTDIKRMAAGGGVVEKVGEFTGGRLCAWDAEGWIYLTTLGRAIFRLPATGGKPHPLTVFEKGDLDHFSLTLIAGTRDFLYSVRSEAEDGTGIYVSSFHQPQRRKKISGALSSSALSGSHLVYQSGERLLAARYDTSLKALAAEPVQLEPQVAVHPFSGAADLTASSGVLAYRTGKTTSPRELVWMDRNGTRLENLGEGAYRFPAISPGGDLVAVEIIDMNVLLGDIWVLGLNSHLRRRISFDRANETSPVFTPDGKRIVHSVGRDIYIRDAEGGGSPQLLHASEHAKTPKSISSDGRWLVYQEYHPVNGIDLWLLPMQGGPPVPFHTKKGNAREGSISPDGKWIAYTSNEDGKDQVYVETLAAEGMERERVQVTTNGGTSPQWRSDSRELFLADAGHFYSAQVEMRPKLRIGAVQTLFPSKSFYNSGFGYAASADGKRFLVSAATGDQLPTPQPIVLVLHHPELRQR
ncbi:MAG: serine/threonine-protein kinase [Bryobacterales bacterium]|nr:serine/threonine-protein kinase [Bryobacterales bacterium]